MRISIEQLFYGRGDRGYGVLGTSPGGAPFAARVETLCGAIGTPGSDYGSEPFLLSVPEGDYVLMICGRRGAPDSMGRETLFFHALVATKKDLLAAKADAFSLFARGAFVAKIPSGPIDVLPLEVKPGRDGSTSCPNGGRIVDASLPCFIRIPSPAPDIVRAFVGDRANDLAWATFAFQPLDGFDVQVLPPRIAAPRSMNEFNTDGELVHAAETSGGQAASACSASPPCHHDTPKQTPSSSKPSPTMLKISLFANLVLLVGCAVLLASRKEVPPTAPVSTNGPISHSLATQERIASLETALDKVKKERDDALASLSQAQESIPEIKREAKESFRQELVQKLPDNANDLQKYENLPILQELLKKLQKPITK